MKTGDKIQKIEVVQLPLKGESMLRFHFEPPVPVFEMWFPPGATARYLAASLRVAADRLEAGL